MYTATGFRTLSDIDRSTAANDGQASTLFSATKNPQRIPANTPPVFRGLWPRICLPLLRLVTNSNVGQTPRITVAIGVLAICLAAISPAGTWAAEPVTQEKKAKKPAQARKNVLAPKATAPKFASAETAGKAPSCFGEAPKLDKLTPDEGKAGDRVIITGTNFGEAACLRGVSFGPGHPAQFQQTNDSITTTVPRGGKKGLVLLTVTTASGENSKPFLLR
ncbi:MAG: hypothetical protein L0Z46_11485 [Nitrospiraceae bacterium]|nr:hypothetical protein [Nitrospiraceae bacterium]